MRFFLLDSLNDKQKLRPYLLDRVVKTRVLVHRSPWLLSVENLFHYGR